MRAALVALLLPVLVASGLRAVRPAGSRPGDAVRHLGHRTARKAAARVRLGRRQRRAGRSDRRGQTRRRRHARLADRRRPPIPADHAAALRPLGDAPALAPRRVRALRAPPRGRARRARSQDRLLPERRLRDARPQPHSALDRRVRRAAPGARTIREGISPGFGDDYVPQREGQSIDVTGLPPGRYVLVHRANPSTSPAGTLLREQRSVRGDRIERPPGARAGALPRFGHLRNLSAADGVERATEGGKMRKLIVFTALTALICVPAALAKERNLTLAGKPSVTKAGKAWTATVNVTIDKEPQAGKAPTIRLHQPVDQHRRTRRQHHCAPDGRARRLPRAGRVSERGNVARRRRRHDDRPRVLVRANVGPALAAPTERARALVRTRRDRARAHRARRSRARTGARATPAAREPLAPRATASPTRGARPRAR